MTRLVAASDKQILARMLSTHVLCLKALASVDHIVRWPRCGSGGGRPDTLFRWGLAEEVRVMAGGVRPQYLIRITERGRRILETHSRTVGKTA